ncbi:MAG: hypothetical protein NDJ90_00085 [Oligoflexia bacterium]|nr:hypothetical protein [Oligoflexia bacterium]
MAPIYESDIAEERFARSEWNHYELWEKVEVRLRRHRRLWIAGTVVLFLVLSSVPTVVDQRPKWASLGAIRVLGQELNRLKREAALGHSAYRLRFAGEGSLDFTVEKTANCLATQGESVRTGTLRKSGIALSLLNEAQGAAIGVPGLKEGFCFDPLLGAEGSSAAGTLGGFAIIPAKDLTEGRNDRLSVLLLNGPTGEVSVE